MAFAATQAVFPFAYSLLLALQLLPTCLELSPEFGGPTIFSPAQHLAR
jgi:hypothetical protein